MSYILDALKKAERERELGHVPHIDTIHDTPAHSRVRPWMWVIGAALALNAAVIVVTMRSSFEAERAANTHASSDADTPAPSGRVAPVPTVPRAASRSSAPLPAVAVDAPRPAPVASAAPAAEPERPKGLQSALPPPPPGAAAAASPQGGASVAAASEVPLLRDLSPEFQNSLPGLRLDVHVYADRRDQRFVLINLRKYREGERLAEGPMLEKITPEGVILAEGGQRFRLLRP